MYVGRIGMININSRYVFMFVQKNINKQWLIVSRTITYSDRMSSSGSSWLVGYRCIACTLPEELEQHTVFYGFSISVTLQDIQLYHMMCIAYLHTG